MGLFLGSILSHWSICLFFCQYDAVLITVALYSVILGSIISSNLDLQDCCGIQGLLSFCVNFYIIDSSSVKYAIGIFIGIALSL